MAPQALIFTKWFCGKAAEAHYLEGDIIELEFHDSPQIKLTLEDLWFFEFITYAQMFQQYRRA